MANPVLPGAPVGDPAIELAGIVIERETLIIDLRPLEMGEPAAIEASYALSNDGPERALDLVFVAAALAGDGTVTLDGMPVAATSGEALELPETWRPPAATPGLGEEEPLPYEVGDRGAIRFALDLPTGRHTVRVRYRAMPTARSGGAPTRYWQLGYVLAPARRWQSFGHLDVEVRLPAGWSAASDPALARDGNVLRGSWDGVPADALALTVQAPAPATWPWTLGIVGVLAGGLALSVGAGALLGRGLGRRRRTSAWALPLSLLLPCLWVVAVAAVLLRFPAAIHARAGEQAAWTYGAALPYALVLVVPAVLVVGFLSTQLATFLSARRARRRLS